MIGDEEAVGPAIFLVPTTEVGYHPWGAGDALGALSDPAFSSYPNLSESIAREGIRVPIFIETDGAYAVVADGKHRANVAARLGIEQVPARVEWRSASFAQRWAMNPVGPALRDWLATEGNRKGSKEF